MIKILNFWRTLEMPFITPATKAIAFAITYTKLYVLVVPLSTQGD